MFSFLKRDSLLSKAEKAFKKEGLEPALKYINEASEVSENKAPAAFVLARMYIDGRDYEKAINHMEEYTAEHKYSSVAYLYLGIANLLNKSPDKAIVCFEKVKELSPENVLADNFYTLCKFMLGEKEAVNRLKLKYLHGSGIFTAMLYIELYKYVYAEEIAELKIKIREYESKKQDEISEKAVEKLGTESVTEERNTEETQEERSHDEKQAKKDEQPSPVKKVSFLDSSIAFFYFLLGRNALDRDKVKKAVSLLARANELDSSLRRLHFSYGEALIYDKQYDLAQKELGLALIEDGEAPEIMYYLGKIYQKNGDFGKASDFFEKTLKKFSKFPEIYLAYGEMALVRDDFDSALELFQKACQGDSYSLDDLLKEAKKDSILQSNVIANS